MERSTLLVSRASTLTYQQNTAKTGAGKARGLDLRCSWGITEILLFGDRCYTLSYGGRQQLLYILIVSIRGPFKCIKHLNPPCWQATAPSKEHSPMIITLGHPVSYKTQSEEVIQNHFLAITFVTEITFWTNHLGKHLIVSFQRDGKHLIVLKCPSFAARDTESILRSVKGLVPNHAWVRPSGRPSVGRIWRMLGCAWQY